MADKQSLQIFLIAGEESGDILGASLMEGLKALRPDVSFSGIGGQRMMDSGLGESLFPMRELSLMGVFEIAPKIPRLLKRIKKTVHRIEADQPDILVTIDSPDFCFRVAGALKQRGRFKGKIVHYVAPTVWAWRQGRARKVAKFLDGMLCLFPFEPPYFEKEGLQAVYVGHPVMDSEALTADGKSFRRSLGIAEDAIVLGLFPGSRMQELEKTGRVLVQSAQELAGRLAKMEIILPTLPHLEEAVQDLTKELSVPVHIVASRAQKWPAFRACDGAMATSGTVGLELAVAGVPHIIGYRMSPITYQIAKRVVKTPYAHLANVILGRRAVPEFIQDDCTAGALANEMVLLFKNLDTMKADFEQVRSLLHTKDSPSRMAAGAVLDAVFAERHPGADGDPAISFRDDG